MQRPQNDHGSNFFSSTSPAPWLQNRSRHIPTGNVPPIGASLNAIRAELCASAGEMETLLDGAAKKLVEESRRVLQSMVCRIAIVGQIKAGKSSLINALIRQPVFLPSDVNPWTTAVTRLHFGQEPQKDVAAEFRFFDAEEWRDLAEGGGRIRELTERLVPGFQAQTLHSQLKVVRDRAARRLGREFKELLGKSHTFSQVDKGTLEGYVCAGATTESHSTDAWIGRYSDITKSAHLYLGDSPFGFPATIIDTPGTNDPLLVRDEITRRALEAADVFVVVLTAKQALSADDVALLRILRGLQKDRIVVFINRIDELSSPESDLEAVQTHVARVLRREFPNVHVPIVLGSARWANEAIVEAGDRAAQLLLIPPNAQGWTADAAAADRNDLRFTCSGLGQLSGALDRAIGQSHPARVVRQLVKSFGELVRINVLVSHDGIKGLQSTIAPSVLSASAKERQMQGISLELDRLHAVELALATSLDEFQEALTTTLSEEMEALRFTLRDVVENFATGESRRLTEAAARNDDADVWQCDTGLLRKLLEDEFDHRFRSIKGTILAAEADILPRLQAMTAQVMPKHRIELEPMLSPAPMLAPNLSSLSTKVSLDLDAPWWRSWWSGKRPVDHRREELVRLIRLEFLPLAENVVQSAQTHILTQISATLEQARGICLGVAERLRRQSAEYGSRLNDLRGMPEGAEASHATVRRVAELEGRHRRWNDIQAQLDSLSAIDQRLNTLLSAGS
jgi:signal recognition particle receptor subunit beta